MDGYTVSEHCFDFKDSTHKTGTNKYEFRYPQSWYLMNAMCDLSVGIRNIILKPGPIDISLNDFWLVGFSNNTYNADEKTWIATEIEQPATYVSISGVPLKPERIPMMEGMSVDEKIDMIDFCEKLNNQYKEDYTIFEKQCIDAYQAYKYMGITNKSARFYYDGGFGMSTNNLNQYFMYQLAGDLSTDNLMDLPVGLFDDKFHILMGLDYKNPDQNLNRALKVLAYKHTFGDGGYVNELLKWNRQGIHFGKVILNPEYKSGTQVVKNTNESSTRPITSDDKNWPSSGETTVNIDFGYKTIKYSKDGSWKQRITTTYTEQETDDYKHTLYVELTEINVGTEIACNTVTIEKYIMTVSGEDDDIQGKDYLGNYKYTSSSGVYAVNDPTDDGKICLIFNSLYIDNVWSRKGILVTSSIADFDERNYLGYSSFVSNNTNATYANPKMYPITNQSFTFWIELWDSYTEQKLELPPNSNVLIEACLYQKDKRTFNND